jgi:hypothetical protein
VLVEKSPNPGGERQTKSDHKPGTSEKPSRGEHRLEDGSSNHDNSIKEGCHAPDYP